MMSVVPMALIFNARTNTLTAQACSLNLSLAPQVQSEKGTRRKNASIAGFLQQILQVHHQPFIRDIVLMTIHSSRIDKDDSLEDGHTSLFRVLQTTGREFMRETSMLGINRIGNARYKVQRWFWLCLWIVGCAVTMRDLLSIVNEYYEYPSVTDRRVDYQPRTTFPAVTVCNHNAVACSRLLQLMFQHPDHQGLSRLAALSGCQFNGRRVYQLLQQHDGVAPLAFRDHKCFKSPSAEGCKVLKEISKVYSNHTLDRKTKRNVRNTTMTSSRSKFDLTNPNYDSLSTTNLDSEGPEISEYDHTIETISADAFETDLGNHERRDKALTTFMALDTATRIKLGHPFEELVKECSYKGESCLKRDMFTVSSVPIYGNCFTFNGNTSTSKDPQGGTRSADMVGFLHGLSMSLFLSTDDYMASVFPSSGARVVIHDNDNLPQPLEEGLDIMPGAITSISILQTRIERLEAPYPAQCYSRWEQSGLSPLTENEAGRLVPTGERYSLKSCDRICSQLSVIDQCGCYSVLFPKHFLVRGELVKQTEPCDLIKDRDCLNDVRDKVSHDHCSCSVPCHEMKFNPIISMARLGDPKIVGNTMQRQKNGQADRHRSGIPSAKLHNQNLQLRVHFRDLNAKAIIQYAKFSSSSLTSDIGGSCSWFLGMAMLTLAEVLEFLVIVIYNTCLFFRERSLRLGNPRTSPSEKVQPKTSHTQTTDINEILKNHHIKNSNWIG